MNKTRLAPLAVVLAVACGGDTNAEISGQWDWAATFTLEAGGVSCVTSGSLLLSQSSGGSRITGLRSHTEVACEGGPDNLEEALRQPGAVINSNVRGNVITMEIDFCEFEGTIMLDTPAGDVMSGTLECQDGLSIQPGVFTGTWEASR
jgi:hypothetical protein